ncbi:RED-like protein N-terminal region-domain-containing protein [Fimicolochytrium jonesii]|uniref:RED-like protein N-terminal region-domain-containing protein n=1 Tax=Fimicolochytrium jonesii TaxID=1396493 RepID=UPI0022FE3DD5|nr:RED-like protein N-terminal region-domain-containing protein [Fimicolochytrium jonesii]KAI8817552.1 RED-like protein N-terminal region-domain-containing protein [Fimicolochytrium jonesii]
MSGLGQDDFRKLLATPRAVSQQQTPRGNLLTPRSVASKEPVKDADGFVPPAPVKPKNNWKPQKKSNNDGEEEEGTGIVYRDRAKERRKGVNPDYVETEQMLAVLNAGEQPQMFAAGKEMEPSTPNVSYAQSKYLGGDVKHTHMVKGLDYALLEKVQKDLKEKDIDRKKDEEAMAYVEQMHGGGPTTFLSMFAKNVYEIAVNKAKIEPPVRNEMFIPGRMAFCWEADTKNEAGEIVSSSDIPTTVIRSKADLKDYDKNFVVSSNDLVIEKIISVIAAARENTPGAATEKKRVKRKDKEKALAEAEAARKAKEEAERLRKAAAADSHAESEEEDPDEDIFADVGRDYVLEVKDREGGPMTTYNTDKPSKPPYFLNPDPDAEQTNGTGNPDAMEIDAPPVSNVLQSIIQQSVGMVDSLEGTGAAQKLIEQLRAENTGAAEEFGPQDTSQIKLPPRASRRRKRFSKDVEAAAANTEEDHLADLADLDHSESDGEEPDLSQMDMGVKQNKRSQLQRFDFDTEEEWHRYKDEQVHLPKAAFQFGVKAGEGRMKANNAKKRGGGEGKEKNYDAKFNKEFQQLNKVYSNKYGTELESGGAGKARKSNNNKRQKRS